MNEDEFLARLFARLPAAPADVRVPPGDDCAAVDVGGGRLLLLAVDQVVAERHYHAAGPDAATAGEVGRKLLARNLSDVAAMGGHPRFCLVAGAFGPGCGEAWMGAFHEGLIALAREVGVALIGGDLATSAAGTVASLTIVGEVGSAEVVRRCGAMPGDEFWATGVFGSALRTGHHLRFVPRCAEGAWLGSRGLARAMIDVSDGLLLDALRLCRASGLSLRLAPETVPRRTPETTLDQALGDGEDYELLFAVRPADGPILRQSWPFETPLHCLGHFEAGEPGVRDLAGRPLQVCGYDHLACREGV